MSLSMLIHKLLHYHIGTDCSKSGRESTHYTFSISKWNELSTTEKESHTLSNCDACYCHECCIIVRALCYVLLCNCVGVLSVLGLLYALKQNCVLGLISIVKASASWLQARVERTH